MWRLRVLHRKHREEGQTKQDRSTPPGEKKHGKTSTVRHLLFWAKYPASAVQVDPKDVNRAGRVGQLLSSVAVADCKHVVGARIWVTIANA